MLLSLSIQTEDLGGNDPVSLHDELLSPRGSLSDMLTEHGLFPVDSLWAEMGRAGRRMQVEGGGLKDSGRKGDELQTGRGITRVCKECTLV